MKPSFKFFPFCPLCLLAVLLIVAAHDVSAQHSDVKKRFDEFLKTAHTDAKTWPIRENAGKQAGKKKATAASQP